MSEIISVREQEELRLPQVSEPAIQAPVVTKGKFFFVDGEKFFVKGVTYGPFKPASHGAPFPNAQ